MGFETYRRAETEEELRRRNARLDLLADGARQLLSNDTPEHIVQVLCERVMEHLDCQVFSSFVSPPGPSPMRLVAFAGMPREALKTIDCPQPDSKPSECVHRPGCQRADICAGDAPAAGKSPLPAHGIHAYACHPLVYKNRNIGTLSFGTRSRPRFSDDDLDLMRAIADLVAAALARKQWEQELEQRVAERTAELTAANKELEGFTYAASHDMRAPLGRISAFSELLVRNYRHLLEGDGMMMVDLIQQNAERLNALVADLLDHAHIGKEPLPLQPIEAHSAVQAILLERADDIRDKGAHIRLELPGDIRIRSNPLGLSQVLRNLVDNALKYSSRASTPVIEIGGRRHEDRCHLWVRDNGIGIDVVYQERIFEIFRRLHTYSEFPGNGIGLALVKRAVERMDGRIWVESEVGQGATFFVDLPVHPPEDGNS